MEALVLIIIAVILLVPLISLWIDDERHHTHQPH
jgi:hypothetical protein